MFHRLDRDVGVFKVTVMIFMFGFSGRGFKMEKSKERISLKAFPQQYPWAPAK